MTRTIKSIHAIDFQGLADLHLELGRVTTLYGPIGAGKSSVADAIAWALTGETPRGGNAERVIRQGGDAAKVTLALADDSTLGRKRTPSATTLGIAGAIVKKEPFDAAVRKSVGDVRALRAVLRSGAILTMPKADLQQFLVDLTGAKFDATSIVAALGTDVVDAATRHGLALPKSIDSFGGFEASAVERRKAAKRSLEDAEESLRRMPAPVVDVGERKASSIEAVISKITEKRNAAARAEAAAKASSSAVIDERKRALTERIDACTKALADLPAMESGRFAADVQKDLVKARSTAATAEAEAKDAARQIAEAKKWAMRDGDAALADDLENRTIARNLASKILGDAEAKNDRVYRDFAEVREQINDAGDLVTCSGPCAHCAVNDAAVRIETLRARFLELREAGIEGKTLAAKLADDLDAADHALTEATEAKRRCDVTRAAVDWEAIETTKTAAAKAARKIETKFLADLAAIVVSTARASDRSQRTIEIDRLTRELAAAQAEQPAPAPEVNVAELDARIATERQALAAALVRDTRATAADLVEARKVGVREADLVAKALGKEGVRQALIAGGIAPFVDEVNHSIVHLFESWTFAIDPDDFSFLVRRDGETMRAEELSDGERQWLIFVLQIAVATLAKIPFVVFDRVEMLDGTARTELDALVTACVAAGTQVLMLRHGTPANITLPEGCFAYVLANGACVSVHAG